jgi:UDP-N-acetylglucosamine--N-acetylmuramyl-(pentapeptide) pyrophosphoryl-undecaprenol N-acetylglucosamine transferase
MIEQPDLSAAHLADTIAAMDRNELLAMAEKARQASMPDADKVVAQAIADLVSHT